MSDQALFSVAGSSFHCDSNGSSTCLWARVRSFQSGWASGIEEARGGASLSGSDLGGDGGGASADTAGPVNWPAESSAAGEVAADSAGEPETSGATVVWAFALDANPAVKIANANSTNDRVITARRSLSGVLQERAETFVGVGGYRHVIVGEQQLGINVGGLCGFLGVVPGIDAVEAGDD